MRLQESFKSWLRSKNAEAASKTSTARAPWEAEAEEALAKEARQQQAKSAFDEWLRKKKKQQVEEAREQAEFQAKVRAEVDKMLEQQKQARLAALPRSPSAVYGEAQPQVLSPPGADGKRRASDSSADATGAKSPWKARGKTPGRRRRKPRKVKHSIAFQVCDWARDVHTRLSACVLTLMPCCAPEMLGKH